MSAIEGPPSFPDHQHHAAAHERRRLPIIMGQDSSRWTDFYHATLTASWLEFFLGLGLVFFAINLLFALLYMADPHGIANARPGSLADAFFFSVQTFGSIGYGAMTPHTTYANVLVTVESFFSIVNIAVATGSRLRPHLAAHRARAVLQRGGGHDHSTARRR